MNIRFYYKSISWTHAHVYFVLLSHSLKLLIVSALLEKEVCGMSSIPAVFNLSDPGHVSIFNKLSSIHYSSHSKNAERGDWTPQTQTRPTHKQSAPNKSTIWVNRREASEKRNPKRKGTERKWANAFRRGIGSTSKNSLSLAALKSFFLEQVIKKIDEPLAVALAESPTLDLPA